MGTMGIVFVVLGCILVVLGIMLIFSLAWLFLIPGILLVVVGLLSVAVGTISLFCDARQRHYLEMERWQRESIPVPQSSGPSQLATVACPGCGFSVVEDERFRGVVIACPACEQKYEMP